MEASMRGIVDCREDDKFESKFFGKNVLCSCN